MPLSEIGCLRLDWPKDLFAFVGRYQLELECRDRFGGSSSGTCPTCDKYIQVNLGKHVALYHLDLAQLWRCPVDWCPVWKGTSQDCVDHMRIAHNTPISVKAGNLARWFPPWTVTREQWHSMSRPVDWCPVWKGTSQDCVDHMRIAHNTPISVKAGNLARWFPPWTVTREQWHSMSRPSVSGIAIDTFLFSRIGAPLFHRYRVFDRLGSHPAFRGPYYVKTVYIPK